MVFLRAHQPYSGTEVLMETKLERIAEISANSPRPEFTSVYHLINKEMLLQCHKELDGNKAVKKYLKVGVLDNGELMVNEEGSDQGNIISPILANIYMHNVLTLWYKFIITKECKGDNFLIVYADDFVAGFQYKWEAENYYKLLKERMEKFGLQLEDSKSRLLQSGAYIARAKQKSGECIRLQTFDFLGFTFYCGRSRKGMPYIMPKTSSKKFRQKIRDIKVWLYANRDQPLKKLMGMLNLKLIGHYRYYGISFNGRMISNYKQQVREYNKV